MNKLNVLINYLTNHCEATFTAFEKAFRNDIKSVVNYACQENQIFLVEDKKDLTQELLIKLYDTSIMSRFDTNNNMPALGKNFKNFLRSVAHYTALTRKRKIAKHAKQHFSIDRTSDDSADEKIGPELEEMQTNFNFDSIDEKEFVDKLRKVKNALSKKYKVYYDMLIDYKINNLTTSEIEQKYNTNRVGSKIFRVKEKIKGKLILG